MATGQNTVCRGVTLDLYASTGIAYNFSEAAQSVLDKVWPTSGKSVRQTGDFFEAKFNVYHRSAVAPEIPLCQG